MTECFVGYYNNSINMTVFSTYWSIIKCYLYNSLVNSDFLILMFCHSDVPMISLILTGWARKAGGLLPAMFTATTRKFIFSPVGKFLTT